MHSILVFQIWVFFVFFIFDVVIDFDYVYIFCACGYYRADPFAKKDWYDIKAPSVFTVKNVGKTLVTRTQGTKVSSFYFYLFVGFYYYCLIDLMLCLVNEKLWD